MAALKQAGLEGGADVEDRRLPGREDAVDGGQQARVAARVVGEVGPAFVVEGEVVEAREKVFGGQ
jgi:hypothetical protein